MKVEKNPTHILRGQNGNFLHRLPLKVISYIILGLFIFISGCSKDESVSPSKMSDTSGSDTGKNGSMSRFTVFNDYLYVVDQTSLNVYKLTNPDKPIYVNKAGLGLDIETLFPYKDKLFVGSSSRIYIFDLQNPEQPQLLSTTNHIRIGCDPVVVENDYAYTTLRLGQSCTGSFIERSSMEIYDVKDFKNPKRLNTMNVVNPYGLGIDNKLLFLCNGDSGFSVYSLENPASPSLIQKYSQPAAYDVIPMSGENRLMLTGKDGFFQFDYTDPRKMITLSKISIEKPK